MSLSTTSNNINQRITPGSISELFIEIRVVGEVKFNISRFYPRMVNRYSTTNHIYFIPTIPITLKNLINSNLINKNNITRSDFIDVFTNFFYLNKVLNSIKKNKTFRELDLSNPSDNNLVKNIIENNINLILSIFFNNKNKLLYTGREYPISNFVWNGKYNTILTGGKFPNFSIQITLNVLNSNKYGTKKQFKTLTCNDRKKRILDFFGIKTSYIPSQYSVPALYSSGNITYKPIPRTNALYYNRPNTYRPYQNLNNYSFYPRFNNYSSYPRFNNYNTYRRGGKKTNRNYTRKRKRYITKYKDNYE